MKIIRVDNFDRESYSDFLVAEKVLEHYGKIMTDALNSRETEGTSDFFKLVDDNHKLFVREF